MYIGWALHGMLLPLQPGHGEITKASCLPRTTGRPVETRFRFGSGPEALNLAVREQLAGSLNKRHAVRKMNLPSDRMYARGFRRSFTPLSGCFSPFPHGTVHYRSSARI